MVPFLTGDFFASSVLDLSARTQGSVELSRLHGPSSTSPTGLGDLRNISRRGWSKSAEDLSKVSPVEFSPAKPSFQERIVGYRNRSGSNAISSDPSDLDRMDPEFADNLDGMAGAAFALPDGRYERWQRDRYHRRALRRSRFIQGKLSRHVHESQYTTLSKRLT